MTTKRLSKYGTLYNPRPTTRLGRLSAVERLALGIVNKEELVDIKRNSKTPTELQEHLALAQWLRNEGVFFIHVPNEGKRSKQAHIMLLRMGMVPGASDFLIFGDKSKGHPNIALELKRPSPAELKELAMTRSSITGAEPFGQKSGINIYGNPKGSGSTVSDAQILFLQQMGELGWETSICYGWERAVGFLRNLPLTKHALKRI